MSDAAWGGVEFFGIVFGAIILLAWLRHRYPKGWHRACKGSGQVRSSLTGRWRDCGPCDGTGVIDRSRGRM